MRTCEFSTLEPDRKFLVILKKVTKVSSEVSNRRKRILVYLARGAQVCVAGRGGAGRGVGAHVSHRPRNGVLSFPDDSPRGKFTLATLKFTTARLS